ncbi:MAG: hypothetical protein AB7Q97_00915 [Gammaproteobacteria bacterium]
MQTEPPIQLPYPAAFQITKVLREDLRSIDREIRKCKSENAGETTMSVLRQRRKSVRSAYDALKSAGVETEDTTIVNDW